MIEQRIAQAASEDGQQLWFLEALPDGTVRPVGAVPDAVSETDIKFGPISRSLREVFLTQKEAAESVVATLPE